MEYLSMIYKYHYKCCGKPNYNVMVPNPSKIEIKHSAFEISPEALTSSYLNLQELGLVLQNKKFLGSPTQGLNDLSLQDNLQQWHYGLTMDEEFRVNFKNYLLSRIIELTSIDFISGKDYYHRDLLQVYCRTWDEAVLSKESLETMWIFWRLYLTTINEDRIEEGTSKCFL